MEVISRGKCVQGLAWRPRVRRRSCMSRLSTIRTPGRTCPASRLCHLICNEAGTTTRMRPRAVAQIKLQQNHACLDSLARPTSSATRRFHAGHLHSGARRGQLVMPNSMRRGKEIGSGLCPPWRTHPQRTASRRHPSLAGSSKPVGSGRAIFSWTLAPGLQLPDDLKFLAETLVVRWRSTTRGAAPWPQSRWRGQGACCA